MIRYICILVTIYLVASNCESDGFFSKYEIQGKFSAGNQSDSSRLQIVGGEVANITEVPYQVALLRVVKSFFQIYKFNCGGSIISKSVIVSAAHCFQFYPDPKDWKIRAGSTYYSSGGQLMDVSKIIVHPEFSNLGNNISLIILTSELTFGPEAQPVPLASVNQDIPDNSPALVSGWGVTEEGGSLSTRLRKVVVFIYNHDECNRSNSPHGVSSTMICAGINNGGKDACSGDSGGPMVINNTLVGIVSWGYGCARKGFPGVYSSVPALRQWVDDTLNNINL